ncbi:ABC transporter substrate-binding protein [Aliamphritea hakodatensis]|uniref:ABC transporter substrate-binding protein n=1 Tax=Aliamphritea hakodatensis TaxID=2895352 RepID=UPI0022FD5775|nr:ABC transporter substrate binding protein [Aliamphritea hakodatensis]
MFTLHHVPHRAYHLATLFIVFALLAFNPSVSQANQVSAKDTYKVFILHSYELDHVCGQPQSAGVTEALNNSGFSGKRLTIEAYAMDTKRTNTTPQSIAAQAEIALQKISEFQPDVLVTLDDNAFYSVVDALEDPDLPVVFSGLNNLPGPDTQTRWLQSRKQPGANVTGVYEKIHFVTAVQVQRNINTELRKMLVLSDNSPTGKALIRQIREELQQNPLDIEFEYRITDSWEEYQQFITEANASDINSLYPVALRLIDRLGKTYTGNEILQWTAKHSRKPSIPLNFSFVQLGLFGGAGVDFHAMGYQAGLKAAAILQGEEPGNIPIDDARRYALVFNLPRARNLGIEIPQDILLAADIVYTE